MSEQRNRSLESRLAVVEERQAMLFGEIFGGAGIERKDTVRGRLHDLAEKIGTAEALRHYAERLEQQAEKRSDNRIAELAVLVAVLSSLPGWIALLITWLS